LSRYPEPTIPVPSEDEIIQMLQDHVLDNMWSFETSDGCEVEADGKCCHGHPTWILRAGYI
jgi:hypothetical protein